MTSAPSLQQGDTSPQAGRRRINPVVYLGPVLLLLLELVWRVPAYLRGGRAGLAAALLIVALAGMGTGALGMKWRTAAFDVRAALAWGALFVASALNGFASGNTIGDLLGWVSLLGVLVTALAAVFDLRRRSR